MKTRILSLVLAIVMLMSLASIAGAEGATTFKIFAAVGTMSPDNSTKPLVKQMNEAKNVEIVWECIAGDDMIQERKNLLFASNDLPDAFMGLGSNLSNYDIITYGLDGAIIPLEDYITPEIMPNLCKVIEKRPQMMASCTMPDGHIYTLPTVGEMGFQYSDGKTYEIGSIPQFTIINTAWLEKLNLKMPTTIDELHDVLVAFRDQDPNGNGKKDEIPLSFKDGDWCADMTTLWSAFGLTDYVSDASGKHRGLQGDTVVYKAVSEEYKNAIATFAQWYAEGLIDLEVFSQDSAQYIAKGKNEDVILGCYVWWEIPEVVGYDRADMYSYLLPLKGADGTCVVNLNETNTVSHGDFAVTSKCADPAKLLNWVDQLYDPINTMVAAYGPIGEFFEAEPDENGVYVNATPAEGTTEGEMKEIMCLYGPKAILSEMYGTVFYMEPRAQERLNDLNNYWFGSVSDTTSYPAVVFTEEETNTINDLISDINAYVDEMRGLWLTGKADINADWDGYVAQLENMGLQQVISCWQAAYDRFAVAK